MKSLVVVALLAGCLAVLPSLMAQDQPGATTQPAGPMHHGRPIDKQHCQEMMQHRQQMMQQMKQQDDELQQKMQAVEQASDMQQKVQAMQDLLNTMVQQRVGMHERMTEMHQKMMGHMMDHYKAGKMDCPALPQGQGGSTGADRQRAQDEPMQ